jgi:hypothetical protein
LLIKEKNMNTNNHHEFDDFVNKKTMMDQVSVAYPTSQSFAWFIRINRDRLVAANAMILVAGRWRFHPDRLKDVIIAVGVDKAARAERINNAPPGFFVRQKVRVVRKLFTKNQTTTHLEIVQAAKIEHS